MESKQKWAVKQCMSKMCETMDIDRVLLELQISGAITREYCQELNRISNPKQRSVKLLTEMPDKTPENGTAWDHLINVLVKIDQKHLAENLNSLLAFAPEYENRYQTEINLSNSKLWKVPLRNPQFTGRDQLLYEMITSFSSNELSTRMQNINTSSKPEQSLSQSHVTVISALYGMAGVGKTELAIEFVHRYREMYPNIFWIQAADTCNIEMAYQDLAQYLHVDTKKSIQYIVADVINWFQGHPGCLLIYDNAPNSDVIFEYIPQTGTHVLVTSRNTKWQSLGTCFSVDVFTIEEAREYIQKTLIDPLVMDEVDVLIKLLGCLPIALAQACAYMHKTKLPISRYILLYEEHRQKMLVDQTLPKNDLEPVYVTFDITIEAIEKQSKLAPKLLNLCAYFHNDDIPKCLLKAFAENAENNPELEITDTTLKSLSTYSMLKIHSHEQTLSIHQILQEIIQFKLKQSNKDTFLIHTFNSLVKMFPTGDKIEDNSRFIPHMETVLRHLETKISNENSSKKLFILPLYENLFNAYNTLGDNAKSRAYLERAAKTYELHYGPCHPEVARTLANLGNAYGKLGDNSKSRDCLERALKIQELHYDPNHAEIARTVTYLGLTYGRLGDYTKQRDYLKRALKIGKLHYGSDHLEVAKTLGNLGNAYGSLEDYTKQRDYFERALKIFEFHYGPDHLEVARTLGNLGNACGYLGDYTKQRDYLERAVKIKVSHYGPDHPEVARTLANLGIAYGNLRDYTKQRDYLERAVKIKESHYGPDHPEVARTLASLGDAYEDLGDYRKQCQTLERLLILKEQSFGSNHSEVLRTVEALFMVYCFLRENTKRCDILNRWPQYLKTQFIFYTDNIIYRVLFSEFNDASTSEITQCCMSIFAEDQVSNEMLVDKIIIAVRQLKAYEKFGGVLHCFVGPVGLYRCMWKQDGSCIAILLLQGPLIIMLWTSFPAFITKRAGLEEITEFVRNLDFDFRNWFDLMSNFGGSWTRVDSIKNSEWVLAFEHKASINEYVIELKNNHVVTAYQCCRYDDTIIDINDLGRSYSNLQSVIELECLVDDKNFGILANNILKRVSVLEPYISQKSKLRCIVTDGYAEYNGACTEATIFSMQIGKTHVSIFTENGVVPKGSVDDASVGEFVKKFWMNANHSNDRAFGEFLKKMEKRFSENRWSFAMMHGSSDKFGVARTELSDIDYFVAKFANKETVIIWPTKI